jgi:signal transduction histidine kinase
VGRGYRLPDGVPIRRLRGVRVEAAKGESSVESVLSRSVNGVAATASDASDSVGQAATSWRVPRWLVVVGFWTVIVLAYSTRTEVRTGSFTWVPITWVDALKAAAASWYAWGLLSVGIYWVNRALPVPRDALFKRLLFHVPLSLAFTVAYTYLNYGFTQALDAPIDANWVGETVLATLSRVTYRLGTFVYWAIVAMCVALEYQSDSKDRELRNVQLERLLSEARLATLRTQLDPHFLFNTLNAISAYVESRPREARSMLEQLGDMLRMSLESADDQEIPLERELAFSDRYVQLQLVRLGDRLDVVVDVGPEVLGAAVPTFILQPLIENAIRHGVSKLTGPGRIALRAVRDGDTLRLSVSDNGPGLPEDWRMERHLGIGLTNTQARLRHLYGEQQDRLRVGPAPGGGALVEIALPFRPA